MLTQASREEAAAVKKHLMRADSSLNKGLGHHFLGMAAVESVDHLDPDSEALKEAAKHFRQALESYDETKKAERAIVETARTIKGSDFFLKRIDVVSEDVENLRKGTETLVEQLSSGKYPTANVCAQLAASVTRVVQPMERNARIELGKGE